jgi:uncharacterized Zn finger protein (UPF0148 family)
MMTCSDCGTNLDRVPVGVSCPNCDSLRRDATVSATTINAADLLHPPEIFEEDEGEIAANQAEALTTSMSVEGILAEPVDALLSRHDVRKVAETGELTFRYNPSTDEASGWVVQAWHGDELISMAPGEKFADAYLAMGDEIEDHLAGDD